jgi:redox-sensitive bicupin YhaK (pirin superfamily)
MIVVRKSERRGHADHGWLDTRHTFSFGDYVDPEHMGFRVLRVINEDRVAPGTGFGMHRHRDMEIISYVVSGALEHKDSMGHGAVLKPGEVQRISAGSGIAHSEFNPSNSEPVHFLQIWLLPQAPGLSPNYEQRAYPASERQGRLRLVASPDGSDGSVTIQQDARMYAALLGPGQSLAYQLANDRHAWLQVVMGTITVNKVSLQAGDGAAISGETSLTIAATAPSELLLFDLP